MIRCRQAAVAFVVAVLAALFVLPSTALAHSELLQADPAPGSVLDTAPRSITLTFSEPMEISPGAIRLFDGSGRAVEIGAANHPGGADTLVTALLGELPNGSYIVDWRLVSADSHPVQGAYTFQVGPTADLQSGILDGIVGRNSTNRAASAALAITRGLVIVSIAVVFGGLVAIGWGIVGDNRRVCRSPALRAA